MVYTPSANNPFKMPAEYAAFPLLYRALIRPIREADYAEGQEFLRRFYIGIQSVHNIVADLIASVWDVHDPTTCPAELLQYLKDIVGFDNDFDYLTDRLSTNDLRKLIKLAVPFWKQRFSDLGVMNAIRLLTGRNAVTYNWFYWRAILGEVILSEEQLGYDFWLIGGGITYYDEYHSQIRLMDDGTLDRQLVLDLVSLERVSSERIEVAVVDFLDQFDLARDKWTTLAGTAASLTADKTMEIPAGTAELASVIDYSNIALLHRFKLEIGAILYTYFYMDDWAAQTYYRVEVRKNYVQLTRWVAATPTVLATPTLTFPIHEELWYKLRVSCVIESGSKRIKIYIDGNNVANVLDATATPSGGGLAIAASGANLEVDNVESFRVPLRLAEIGPSGVTTSVNFFT